MLEHYFLLASANAEPQLLSGNLADLIKGTDGENHEGSRVVQEGAYASFAEVAAWTADAREAADLNLEQYRTTGFRSQIHETLRTVETAGRATKRYSGIEGRFSMETLGAAIEEKVEQWEIPFCEKESTEMFSPLQTLRITAPAQAAADRPTRGLGGLWAGAFPDDFDIENALAELRQAEQDHLDDEAAP